MARPVFRPIIFSLKRAPTWPGIVVPYESPDPVWVLASGFWRNIGYWFSSLDTWGDITANTSFDPIFDGMAIADVLGTLQYLIDIYDGTGISSTESPLSTTAKLNEIAYYRSLPQIQDQDAGSDAMDKINAILESLISDGIIRTYTVMRENLLMRDNLRMTDYD